MDIIRVIVAEKNVTLINEIGGLLRKSKMDIEIVGCAYDHHQVLRLIELNQRELQVVILDIDIMGRDAKIVEHTKANYPHVNFIITSHYSTLSYITYTLRAGALAYILKNRLSNELLEAIQAVSKGEKWHNEFMIDLPAVPAKVGKKEVALTEYEQRILDLIAQGFDRDTIAQKVSRKPSTIESHYQNLLAKFKAGNVNELLDIAREKGFLE